MPAERENVGTAFKKAVLIQSLRLIEPTTTLRSSAMSDPYAVTIEEPADDEPNHALRKCRILVGLLIYIAVLGFVSVNEDVNAPVRGIDILMGLPELLLAILWCRTDAAERDHRIGVLTNVCLVMFLLAGLPLYLFQSRGFRALQSLGWLLLFVLTMAAAATAGALVRFFTSA